MKAGGEFDPVDVTRNLKIYPTDTVDARMDLGDGPKRLYSQLFRIAVTTDRRKNPWPGYLFASERFLAGRLGKSESQIRRDSAALRSFGLVRVERPKHQGNNHYFFLWCDEFHSADMRGAHGENDEEHSADMRVAHSADMRCANGVHSADMHGGHSADMRGAYKEEQLVLATTEKPVSDIRERFFEFQSAYPEPKREIKVDSSCRAYLSVVDGKPGEHGRLMAGLARYLASADWRRKLADAPDGRFLPSMEKFLAERVYLDHPPAANEEPDHQTYGDCDEEERIPANAKMPDWGL